MSAVGGEALVLVTIANVPFVSIESVAVLALSMTAHRRLTARHRAFAPNDPIARSLDIATLTGPPAGVAASGEASAGYTCTVRG